MALQNLLFSKDPLGSSVVLPIAAPASAGVFELLAWGRSLAKNVGLIEVARKLALDMELGRV
jgi:hypothetical protein